MVFLTKKNWLRNTFFDQIDYEIFDFVVKKIFDLYFKVKFFYGIFNQYPWNICFVFYKSLKYLLVCYFLSSFLILPNQI
jgi:hypothetical protein